MEILDSNVLCSTGFGITVKTGVKARGIPAVKLERSHLAKKKTEAPEDFGRKL